MSTLSEAGRLLKGSERESRVNVKAIMMVIVGVVILILALRFIGDVWAGRTPFGVIVDRPLPESTLAVVLPTQVAFAMDTATPTATQWPTPIIITNERVVEVPIEVTREVYFNVPVPVEVTRIVEVASIALPTVTPIPLAPGTVKVCASVEGAKSLYIGGEGVVSGGCQIYTFGVGQTTILVQVDK